MTDQAENMVTLTVSGVAYGGWKEVFITRSIEAIAGTFDLSLSEKWSGQTQRRPISDGDACVVKIDDDTVLTGILDQYDPALEERRHDVRAQGRDVTGYLFDCSAMHRPGEWRNRTALQLVATLCEPFGIPVSATVDVGKPFASFKLQEGEVAFEAIDRICKARALLPVSDGLGGLVLMRSGANAPRVDAPLEEGVNIKAIRASFSMLDRYSEIHVKGQQTQLDGMSPDQAAGPSAVAKDPTVPRYRPLIIIADDEGDGVTLRDRALWEVSVRAGRARRAEIEVQGWRNRAGDLWTPNTIIPVRAPTVDIDSDMLITTVQHRQGDAGTTTTLGVAPPKSFDLLAVAEAKKKSGDVGDALIGTPKYVGAELVKASQ